MPTASAQGLARAHEFLDALPPGEDGPERAVAFRALFAAAGASERDRSLLVAVYELVAETHALPDSLHDAHMVVSSVTERLDLLPIIAPFVERYLGRCAASQDQIRDLWRYVLELYAIRYPRQLDASSPVTGSAARSDG